MRVKIKPYQAVIYLKYLELGRKIKLTARYFGYTPERVRGTVANVEGKLRRGETMPEPELLETKPLSERTSPTPDDSNE